MSARDALARLRHDPELLEIVQGWVDHAVRQERERARAARVDTLGALRPRTRVAPRDEIADWLLAQLPAPARDVLARSPWAESTIRERKAQLGVVQRWHGRRSWWYEQGSEHSGAVRPRA